MSGNAPEAVPDDFRAGCDDHERAGIPLPDEIPQLYRFMAGNHRHQHRLAFVGINAFPMQLRGAAVQDPGDKVFNRFRIRCDDPRDIFFLLFLLLLGQGNQQKLS